MKRLSPVVWSEGMHLAPQHFQMQSRYIEDVLDFTTLALEFEPWGLLACSLDEESLNNGTAALRSARGVFPDGTVFECPEADALPAPREIASLFSPVQNSHLLCLTLPAYRVANANVDDGASGTAGSRFLQRTVTQRDETTGADEKPVYFGQKNFTLRLDHEVSSEQVSVPLARVVRTGSGGLAYDPAFIPPSLDLLASPALVNGLIRIIALLEEQVDSLIAMRPGSGIALADAYRSNPDRFWLAHIIHSSLPVLQHLLKVRRGHPEGLYRELARLAGALCSFTLDEHPLDTPLYNHHDLAACFATLEQQIRRRLGVIRPTQFTHIPLTRTGDSFFAGTIDDPRVLDRCRWLLGLRSSAGEARVLGLTPSQVKVCSHKFVHKLVERAMPGMDLVHQAVPPASMPARVDLDYFVITRQGPCWEHIVKTRTVGIYIPAELSDPELELVVIFDQ